MSAALSRAVEDSPRETVSSPSAGADTPIWATDVGRVLEEIGVDLDVGLEPSEARARLADYGANELRRKRRMPALRILGNQMTSVVVWLLIIASALSFILGDVLEGFAIGAAVLLTIAIGFFTELRAIRSMEALRKMGALFVRVRRGGNVQSVLAIELVPGDVVIVEGGDRVSADLRVVSSSRLQADESILTGESIPVAKTSDSVPATSSLADRHNMLFKGTSVVRGAGVGVVVTTGMQTELGHIASLVEETEHEETPLERQLTKLGRNLLLVCLGVSLVTTVVGMLGGHAASLMIKTGVALAVAAIPEGLPVVATIALARGMWRLASRHALIQRLSAVETLGATNIIIADKTGTLTENRMSVVTLATSEATYDDLTCAPRAALEIAALCNNAAIDAGRATGDPLEIALLRAAEKGEIDLAELGERWPRVREEAFDPAVKMMATVHATNTGFRVAVKGAPESVLDACEVERLSSATVELSSAQRQHLLDKSEEMASSGLRVLAVAEKSCQSQDVDVYSRLELVALVGFADPPRADVTAPLATCRAAGIRVIMATGDQPATAASIARAVGMTSGDVATARGDGLLSREPLSAEDKAELLRTEIFARVTPKQKLTIVELHQDAGAIVAMTGDGVNDAPALRKAEIGIAMGQRGTDVAREAADMVLVDDSFESIVSAIEQGRAIFENIRRFVLYLLSCNISEILVVSGAVVLGAPLPLLPLQILFLNLVTDVFPALALGFGKGDPDAMQRPPRDAREAILARRHWGMIMGYAVLITAATLGAMALGVASGASRAEATSIAFLTLGFAQLWHVFNMRQRSSTIVRNGIVANPWVWGALALCVGLLLVAAHFAPLAAVLDVVAVGARGWLIIISMSLIPLIVGQLVLTALPERPERKAP